MAEAKSGRQNARREALLRAAAAVFFEQGYAATSIDAIIERAGGSKRNIYNTFKNKEGLFSAIVTQNADRILSTLVIEGIEGRNLQETLTVFGRRLLEAYMSPSLLGVYRIAIAEANRFPDLARAFYERGPGRAMARLAEILEEAGKHGEVRTGDYLRMADQFVGMIRDNFHLQVVLGLRLPPSADEAREAVDSAVGIFLNGVRPSQDK